MSGMGRTRGVQVKFAHERSQPHGSCAVSQRDVLRANETKHEVTDATMFFLSLFFCFFLSCSLSRAHAARLHPTSHKERRNSEKYFSWRRSRLEQGSMARRRLTFDGRCTTRFCSLFLSLPLSLSFFLSHSLRLSHSLALALVPICVLSPVFFFLIFILFSPCRFSARCFFPSLTRSNVHDGSDARML